MPSSPWQSPVGFERIWYAERAGPGGVPLRAVAFALATRGLAIYSPLPGFAQRERPGPGAAATPTLLAPNHFHSVGFNEHAAAFPEAPLFAAAVARRRLQHRTRRPVGDCTELAPALPAGVSLLVPPGTRNGEVWLSVEGAAGRAWVVGDAFFNIARTPRSPLGLLLRLLGISPGLRVGSSFRWLIGDRPAYRRWLFDTLDEQPPTMLVPCHGDILADPALAPTLRALVERRL